MAKEPKDKRPPIAVDPDRLSKGAERVLGQLEGRRICKQFIVDERVPSGVAFWIEPTGRKIEAAAAEELIRKGRVRPLVDGLFGESQSFEAA